MSFERLQQLDERRAFEATHRYEDLDLFHVRFDELTGRPETEHVLGQMATRGGRVALIGPSGSGKSSVIASVLGPLVENLPANIIPIRIPVAAADAETVTEPRAFAQHIVRTVARYATETLSQDERAELEAGVADVRRRHGRERTRRWNVGAPRLVADAGFASEAKSGAEEIEERLGSGEVVGELARMVAIFRSHQHQREPLLVIDDSDRWLQIGQADLSQVAEAFFTRNVQMLAKELDCGFVVVVHDHYLELGGYVDTRALLSTEIRIPRFENPEVAIGQILGRRIELAEVRASLDELFEADAITELGDLREQLRRWTQRVALEELRPEVFRKLVHERSLVRVAACGQPLRRERRQVLGEKWSSLGRLELAPLHSAAPYRSEELVQRSRDQLFAEARAHWVRAHPVRLPGARRLGMRDAESENASSERLNVGPIVRGPSHDIRPPRPRSAATPPPVAGATCPEGIRGAIRWRTRRDRRPDVFDGLAAGA